MQDVVTRMTEWHTRIVAEGQGREELGSISTWRNGKVIGTLPAFLPAWMLSPEREKFRNEAKMLILAHKDDPAALETIHSIPGVPMAPWGLV